MRAKLFNFTLIAITAYFCSDACAGAVAVGSAAVAGAGKGQVGVDLLNIFKGGVNAPAGGYRLDGPIGSGGGVSIACVEDGELRVYLADTFAAARRGEFKNWQADSPDMIMFSAIRYFDHIRPQADLPHPYLPGKFVTFGWLVAHTRAMLSFPEVDMLPRLTDDHIDESQLPSNCKTVQIAVQNFKTKVVQLRERLLPLISWPDWGFLELHETLLNIRNDPGADTTPIRKAVSDILDRPDFAFEKILNEITKEHEKIPKFDSSDASVYFDKNCPHFFDLGARSTAECVRAWHKASDSFGAQYKARALPIPIELPRRLQCQVGAQESDDLQWRPERLIELVRTAGDGKSGGQSLYDIKGLNLPEGNGSQAAARLSLSDLPLLPNGYAALGDFKMTWSKKLGELSFGIELSGYSSESGELTGKMQVYSESSQRSSTYVVVCHPDKLKTGHAP